MLTASSVGDLHRMTGRYAIWLLGLVGVWGLALAVWRREPGRPFGVGFGVATVAVLAQVGLGLWARAAGDVEPGGQHMFYGIVIVFTLAFAYIYRSQMARRPALAYGVLALFLMGLGMRAIANFGQDL